VYIAICDDMAEDRNKVLTLFQTYGLNKKIPFTYKLFENGFQLLDSIESGAKFDIIVLDIIMPHITGMEAARRIRELDSSAVIIFLTSSPEFAVESYAVNAYYYLLKPVAEVNFNGAIDRLLRRRSLGNEASIIINVGKSIKRLLVSTIVYCEVIRTSIYYHMEDGTVHQTSGTLAGLEKELMRYPQFIKPHRSFLVNLRHVTEVTVSKVVTDIGDAIPLSRSKHNDISHAFLSYVFDEEGEGT
jgi:DNA-binding LytR/AlgR family response regulator